MAEENNSNVVIEELPDDHPVDTPRQFVEYTPRTRKLAEDSDSLIDKNSLIQSKSRETKAKPSVDEDDKSRQTKYKASFDEDEYFPRKNVSLALSFRSSYLIIDTNKQGWNCRVLWGLALTQ